MSALRFQLSSQRLIHRYGKNRIYVRKVDAVYDRKSQTMTSGEELYEVKMKKDQPKERELKSPNLVNKNVCVLVVSALDINFIPKIGDEIRDGITGTEEVFEVKELMVEETGEVNVLWKLYCVRS